MTMLNTILCILLIVGFTIISMFPGALSFNSQIITIPFRAIVLSISLVIIVYNMYTKNSNKFGKTEYFFIVFWLFYFVKAIVTFKIYDFSEEIASREIETYLRIMGITFIPTLAVLTIRQKDINYTLFMNFVYYTLFIVLLLNVSIGIEYDHQGRSAGFMSMYCISFGHLGVSLAIISIYKLLFESKAKYLHIIPSAGVILGLYILYASGTRSPLIAFILCLFFLFFLKSNLKYIISFLILLATSILALIYFKPQYEDVGQSSSFLNRVTNMIVSGDSSGRGELYQQGIKIFSENPIFGGRILYFDGMYPHNIFLEILMATGIVGLILYLYFFKDCVNFMFRLKEYSITNPHTVWVPILWLQYFILSLFSYNLHSSSEVWYLTAMILVLNKKTITEIK
jgi:O-antigen ligase